MPAAPGPVAAGYGGEYGGYGGEYGGAGGYAAPAGYPAPGAPPAPGAAGAAGGYADPYGGYPAEPAGTVPPAYPQSRVRHLLTVDGSDQWHELQAGSNVVGRGQEANVRLPDTGVSRRHIDIRFDGNGAVLHDLGSTNGTTVNGHRVQSWQLQHGDVIRLGHTVIVYRQDAS